MKKLVGILVLLACFMLAGLAQAEMIINGAGASFPTRSMPNGLINIRNSPKSKLIINPSVQAAASPR